MARQRRRKWEFKPRVTYADTEWDVAEKHDEMIDVLLTGRFPLIELQDYLGVKPTKEEKKASGKYGHVKGITYLIQMARLNGWPVQVHDISHVTWVWLPVEVMEEYDGMAEGKAPQGSHQ